MYCQRTEDTSKRILDEFPQPDDIFGLLLGNAFLGYI